MLQLSCAGSADRFSFWSAFQFSHSSLLRSCPSIRLATALGSNAEKNRLRPIAKRWVWINRRSSNTLPMFSGFERRLGPVDSHSPRRGRRSSRLSAGDHRIGAGGHVRHDSGRHTVGDHPRPSIVTPGSTATPRIGVGRQRDGRFSMSAWCSWASFIGSCSELRGRAGSTQP